MGHSIGIKELLSMNFKVYHLSEEWEQSLGTVEQNFRMLIWGESGHGKTTFAMLLCKELAKKGKVYFNSFEQGASFSLQEAVKRSKLDEIPDGKLVFGDRDSFSEMMNKLKKNRARFIIIDSLQYMEMTQAQYKELVDTYPNKAIIMISWQKGVEPKGEHAKAIKYMADIKVHVKEGKAYCQSRFGGSLPFQIMEWKHKSKPKKTQPQLFKNE